ncbi:MAG: fructose-6-phosphate aldolase [Gemmatimonadales bacterium]
MKIHLDSADMAEIRWAASAGLIDGVTTDPTLISHAAGARDPRDLLQEICGLVAGPVTAQVVAVDTEGMYREGKELARLADNIVVQVPMIEDGLAAARRLAAEGVDVNVTLVFSAMQGLLAARAGAAYVSPFVGRLDDAGQDGMEVVGQLRTIFRTYDVEAQILAASLRHPRHVLQAALAGADVAAVPAEVLRQLLLHPLTDRGLDRFLNDWSTLGHPARPEDAS